MTTRAGLFATESVDVAVVGGGPTGAAIGARLARRGFEVAIFERSPAWHWRACGVFSSPATLVELRAVGVSEDVLRRVARPIPRLWIDAPGGASVPLTYGADGVGDRPTAVGFDRSRLDPCLVELAAAAGATIRRGVTVTSCDVDDRGARLDVRDATGPRVIRARIVVGADGVRSTVARSLGVARRGRLADRVGLTYHVADVANGAADGPADGHMVVLDGAYCGMAPVPGGRVNIGIVLAGGHWRARLASDGARAVTDDVLRAARRRALDDGSLPVSLEAAAGASPIAHRVTRRAGAGWLLAGDAAGFLDPFTGEGLHRALVSARLADTAIASFLHGRPAALADYDAAMRRRFAGKDVISWLAQLFLSKPWLFDYAARRLSSRRALAERMGLLMGDLVPASGAVNPRYLAAVLRP